MKHVCMPDVVVACFADGLAMLRTLARLRVLGFWDLSEQSYSRQMCRQNI